MKQIGATVEYLLKFALGFIEVTFTDITMTALAIASVGLGFLTNALIAGTTYLFAYVFLRIINSIANAVGQSGQNISISLSHLAQSVLAHTEAIVTERDPAS